MCCVATQDTTYAETGRPRGQFLRATQISSPTTAPATLHPSKLAAPRAGRRGCEQPRCARGNPKAAAAGGNEDDEGGGRLGKSGAKAPDRDRGREQPRRPARGAAHEATAPKLPTKHNTQFNGSEHTQRPPPQKTYFAATCPGTGFPHPPPNARINPTADRACSPLSCTDTRCCSNTLRSASITSR